MRLCDEYHERMGLDPLRLRHSSKFFLFFDQGKTLLSCKWIESNSSGRYEFRECVLEKTIKVLSKSDVSWSDFEQFLSKWMSSHSGFVFEESRVLSLIWIFFMKRQDKFLSENYSPLLLFKTLNDAPQSSVLIRKVFDEISGNSSHASSFLKEKIFLMLDNYAYWLKD